MGTTEFGAARMAVTETVAPRVRPRPEAGRGAAPARGRRLRFGLRRLLVTVDVLAVTLAWALALAVGGLTDGPGNQPLRVVGTLGVLVLATIVLMGTQRLYRARVCSVSQLETALLGKCVALVAVLALALTAFVPELSGREIVAGSILAFATLRAGRSGYRVWLQRERLRGRHVRTVVVVGTNSEAADLVELVGDHPEAGYRIAGVVGGDASAGARLGVPWLGALGEVVGAVSSSGANGVLVAASALQPEELNRLVRDMLANGFHVQMSSSLRGIGHQRLLVQHFAHEPLVYVEPVRLARWQVAVKRVADTVAAVLALVLVAPVLAVAALAVKLSDRGPVLFRQVRIGAGGRPFKIYKLRTMVPDAEAMVDSLRGRNERGGPLFKVVGDPRVTRVGRVLRATSIDELPQLLNVLRGDMSLVGPRPALPSETEEFDGELLQRLHVAPGITGLWQVEARDNPAFSEYRRLDLFYVENWSLALDLAIIGGTARVILGRAARALLPQRSDAALPISMLD